MGIDLNINVIGDGPRRSLYENRVFEKGMMDRFSFLGWKSRTELASYYRKAHLILLPTIASEGWPKVLSEAMAYGVVPIASTVSSIPYFIKQANSGKVIQADDIQAFVSAIIQYFRHPEIWKWESQNAAMMAEKFTYENYLRAVKDLFKKNWSISLRDY